MADPDRLADAEDWARWAAVHDDWDKTRDLMYILLDSYDRRGVALAAARERIAELEELLEDARSYITPTISTHEDISEVLGWCGCGYCEHVPKEKP